MTRDLWITADDYGLDAGINAGIEELAAVGAVTAVSIMTHAEANLDTVSALASARVSLGPHLVFVEERACLPHTELVGLTDREGRFPRTFRDLFLRLARAPWLLSALAREARAQLARFEARCGEAAFFTSHQHVHLFPPVYRALAPLFARVPAARLRVATARGPSLKSTALYASSRLARLTSGTRRQQRSPSTLLHPIGLEMAGHLSAEGVERALADCASRDLRGAVPELVTHPGHDDGGAAARWGHWQYAWDAEREALRSDRVREIVSRFRRGAP